MAHLQPRELPGQDAPSASSLGINSPPLRRLSLEYVFTQLHLNLL
jgi:hypothetical protein